MKKALLFFVILFSVTTIRASHIIGGEMYVQKINTNQYEVNFLLYQDVYAIGPPGTVSLKSDIPGYTSFTASQVNQKYTKVSCGYDSVSVIRYSANINLNGQIPPAGYIISYDICCRYGGIANLPSSGNGIYVSVHMLPGMENSGRFLTPTRGAGVADRSVVLNTVGYDPDVQDSIHVSFYNVKGGSTGTFIPYEPGYTKDQPFGTSVSTVVDGRTGVMHVDSASQGSYNAGVKIRSYTNGVLTSVVYRDAPYIFNSVNDDLPDVILTNVQGQAQITSNGMSYLVEMTEWDNLTFDIVGSTTKLDTGGNPVRIDIRPAGTLLDTNSGYGGNCAGNNCMTFTTQSGLFYDYGQVKGSFSFSPDTAFVPVGEKYANYRVAVDVSIKDSCGVPRWNTIAFHIRVKQLGAIYSQHEYYSCKGIGVQADIQGDTTGIVWSPTNGVSNVNSATTWLNPSVNTVYTVTHLASGESIDVTVIVDSLSQSTFVLGNNGVQLTAPFIDSSQVTNWFYNGAQLPVLGDSLDMMLTGNYYASITKGACVIFSDTVKAIITAKASNSGSNGSGVQSMASSSSFEFSLVVGPNAIEDIEVVFPESGTGKTAANVTVTLSKNGTVLATTSATQVNDYIYKATGINQSLVKNETYEIEITSDHSNTILFKPDQFPFVNDDQMMNISKGEYVENGNVVSGAYHYVNFIMTHGVGLNEDELEASLYPNPTNNYLTVEVLNNAAMELYDVKGVQVLTENINGKSKIDVSGLADGVYLYVLQNVSGIKRGKLVKQ